MDRFLYFKCWCDQPWLLAHCKSWLAVHHAMDEWLWVVTFFLGLFIALFSLLALMCHRPSRCFPISAQTFGTAWLDFINAKSSPSSMKPSLFVSITENTTAHRTYTHRMETEASVSVQCLVVVKVGVERGNVNFWA